jgi:hypothetical protein
LASLHVLRRTHANREIGTYIWRPAGLQGTDDFACKAVSGTRPIETETITSLLKASSSDLPLPLHHHQFCVMKQSFRSNSMSGDGSAWKTNHPKCLHCSEWKSSEKVYFFLCKQGDSESGSWKRGLFRIGDILIL